MPLNKKDPDFMAYKKARDPAIKKYWADKLIRANQALVTQLVKKYSRFAVGVEHDDLMQAGYIAFLRCLDKSNPNRAFSTLCAYWVRYEVSKCVERSTTIYRPRGSGMPYKLWKLSQEIELRSGRPATAAELGVSQDKLDQWAQLPRTTSIDAVAGDGTTLHDDIADSTEREESADHECMREAMAGLGLISRRIVTAIYLKDEEPKEVAKRFNRPVADILAIADKALEELREFIE